MFFRKSDVISAGDLFVTNGYPFIDLNAGGNVQGAGMDRVSGIVSARSGNTLSVEDGTLVGADGSDTFIGGTTTVTMGPNTRLTVLGQGPSEINSLQQVTVEADARLRHALQRPGAFVTGAVRRGRLQEPEKVNRHIRRFAWFGDCSHHGLARRAVGPAARPDVTDLDPANRGRGARRRARRRRILRLSISLATGCRSGLKTGSSGC